MAATDPDATLLVIGFGILRFVNRQAWVAGQAMQWSAAQ
jgi:hypothetical protein